MLIEIAYDIRDEKRLFAIHSDKIEPFEACETAAENRAGKRIEWIKYMMIAAI